MNTALDRVLARIPDARRVGGGYIVRCPAHDDSSPSLSIREGRSGVLARCWAGCKLEAIAAALGLRVSDLFDTPKPRAISATPQRTPTAREVEAALREHLAHIVDEERQHLGYTPPITSRHHNRARAAVNRILGTSLAPVAPTWYEHAQNDNDPLWKTFAERALVEIVRERYGLDASLSVTTTLDYCDAQNRAATWVRYEARREMQYMIEIAA